VSGITWVNEDARSSHDLAVSEDRAVEFNEALAYLLAMVGQRVEVHVLDAGDSPHLVASFGGKLEAGYSMTGGDPSDQEAIFVRLNAGSETAALSLDRELQLTVSISHKG
jgi:hypothetical protein